MGLGVGWAFAREDAAVFFGRPAEAFLLEEAFGRVEEATARRTAPFLPPCTAEMPPSDDSSFSRTSAKAWSRNSASRSWMNFVTMAAVPVVEGIDREGTRRTLVRQCCSSTGKALLLVRGAFHVSASRRTSCSVCRRSICGLQSNTLRKAASLMTQGYFKKFTK